MRRRMHKAAATNVKAEPPAAERPAPVLRRRSPVVTAHLNPLLVAGVPLGAAVLLMGVYWLILRAGRFSAKPVAEHSVG